MLKKFEFKDNTTISEILEFIESSLKNLKVSSKEAMRAELMSEEALIKLIEHANFTKNKFVSVDVKKFFGDVSVKLRVPGEEFNFFIDNEISFSEYKDDEEDEALETIRDYVLHSFEKNIEYKSTKNYNHVKISVSHSSYYNLYKMLAALVLAVITGLIMRNFIPEEITLMINNNVFETVRSIFLRGLKMCVIPIMFFSIVTCFAQTGSVSSIKRVGLKLVGYTLLTEIIAIFIGTLLVYIFGLGKGMNLIASSDTSETVQNSFPLLKDFLVKMMPNNFVRPFFEGDMIQIIVLAFLVGIATGFSEVKVIDSIFRDITNIFVKITKFFVNTMPILVYCSIASIVIKTGVKTLYVLITILGAIILGFIILICLYCLMIFFIGQLDPVVTLKKASSVLLTALTTSSSAASIPEANKAAQEMGISNQIYSFTLPLGIFFSRSSMCLNTVIFIFSIFNMYGLEIGLTEIFSIGISTIVAVTVIPGSGVIALSSLLASSGAPIEGLSVVVGIYPIMDMFNIATKMFCIIALMLIIAKSEKQLNIEKYKEM